MFSHYYRTHVLHHRGERAVPILKATSLEDYDAAKDDLNWERISRQVRRFRCSLHTPQGSELSFTCSPCALADDGSIPRSLAERR